MRSVVALIVSTIIAETISAAPPITGEYMTGDQSTRYLVWFQVESYAYEQGRDGAGDELNLAPGGEPASYSIAQKAKFPILSYISQLRTKISPLDIFPDLPGDQYSRFGYSVYRNNEANRPQHPAIVSGDNRLCDGIPCGDEWVGNEIGRLNLEGEALWFGLDWADSTPSAPQIKCLFLPLAEEYNCLGIKTGDYYSWQSISYAPVFRYLFLTPFPVDTEVNDGWRHSLRYESRPDSFLIRCFNTDQGNLVAQFCTPADTLMTCLPDASIDSVEISACYGNYFEDEYITLVYDSLRSGPVTAEVDFGKEPGTGLFDLILNNSGESTQDLTLNCNGTIIKNLPEEITLEANQTLVIACEVGLAESDSMDLLIIIRDRNDDYYPYLIKMIYPPAVPLDVRDGGEPPLPDRSSIRIYPNPFRNTVAIQPVSPTAADRIEIFNIIGQKVYESRLNPGNEIIWDGRDHTGSRLSAGIYFVRINDGQKNYDARKIIMLK